MTRATRKPCGLLWRRGRRGAASTRRLLSPFSVAMDRDPHLW
jgi:hypothetical protein